MQCNANMWHLIRWGFVIVIKSQMNDGYTELFSPKIMVCKSSRYDLIMVFSQSQTEHNRWNDWSHPRDSYFDRYANANGNVNVNGNANRRAVLYGMSSSFYGQNESKHNFCLIVPLSSLNRNAQSFKGHFNYCIICISDDRFDLIERRHKKNVLNWVKMNNKFYFTWNSCP